MVLTTLDLLNGLLSIIFVSISTIVGLIIASRYFEYKKPIFIYMGLTWILLVCPWWPSSISVLVALITGNGEGLSLGLYLLIGNFMVPVFYVLLIAGMTELKSKSKQKIAIIISIIIGIAVEIYLFYYFAVDPSQMGVKRGVVDVEFLGFLRIYLFITIVFIVICGILIAYDSISSENREVKLKGKFLLASILVWAAGTLFDGFVELTVFTLTLIRIILISSSVLFYFAFLLPNWLKKHLIKSQ